MRGLITTDAVRRLLLTAAIFLSAYVLLSQTRATTQEGQRTTQAERFLLVDRDGRTLGAFQLGPNSGLPELLLRTREGSERARIGLEENGKATLSLQDGEKVQRFHLSLDRNGLPSIELRDKSGHRRLAASLGGDGSPAIVLANHKGEPCAEWLCAPRLGFAFNFYSSGKTVQAQIGVDAAGKPLLGTSDVSELMQKLDKLRDDVFERKQNP